MIKLALILLACGAPAPEPVVRTFKPPSVEICWHVIMCCYPVPVSPGLACVECCDPTAP